MIIDKQHRELFAPIWAKNQAAVDGKPFVQKYLIKHPAEIEECFTRRMEVSSYNNLPDSILQRWLQIFNKGKVTVEADGFEPIAENIDGKGNDSKDYSDIMFEVLAKFGVSWNLIDLPAWNSEGKSEQDRIDEGIYPYVCNYTQPNVHDWEFDKFDNLTMIVVDTGKVHILKEVGKPPEEKPIYARYVKGNRVEFYLDKEQNEVELSNINILFGGQPVMPWVVEGVLKYSTMPDYFKSPMNAINDASIELYNRSSASGNAYDQTDFQFLAAPEGTLIDVLSNKTLVFYPEGSTAPQWIAPNATNFAETRKELERMSNAIFRLAGMKDRSVSADSAKSGVAMAMEDAQSENKVELIAGTVERTLTKIWDMLALANGSNSDNIKISFPESYATDALEDELKTLKAIFDLKNNAFYLVKFSEFVRRVVTSPEEQIRIIEEAEQSTGLRLSALQSNDVLMTCINNGTLKLANLAQEINPELKEMSVEEVDKWIIQNGEFMMDLKDKFGLSEIQVTPTQLA